MTRTSREVPRFIHAEYSCMRGKLQLMRRHVIPRNDLTRDRTRFMYAELRRDRGKVAVKQTSRNSTEYLMESGISKK